MRDLRGAIRKSTQRQALTRHSGLRRQMAVSRISKCARASQSVSKCTEVGPGCLHLAASTTASDGRDTRSSVGRSQVDLSLS